MTRELHGASPPCRSGVVMSGPDERIVMVTTVNGAR
ncbi:hypothetical protein STRAU_1211 [Streptomyces aurantiacus JA 4570]|uniref:Uncharacterized protein n=1 Tax=Streptomyces aurantiacus JA 4570 TaxID=1286094 RepID=S3ZQJ5_9ACTN|nr:hypothetical protein STRAU_1211 [Streptomyces aurantiacus JA 4570]